MPDQNNLQSGRNVQMTISAKEIVNLTWYNVKFIKPEDLEHGEMYKKFLAFVRDIDEQNLGFHAKECFDILWKLLDSTPNFIKKNPDLLRRYFELLVVLRANFLNLLGDKEIEKFLREEALFALSVSSFTIPTFDFREKLRIFMKWDTWYFDEGAKKLMRNAFTKALESNEEILGSEFLEMIGEKFKVRNGMSNWLRDYNQFSRLKAATRGATERVVYINQSKNVRKLDTDQKNLLLKFLELYDWLKFGSLKPEEETEPAYITAERITIPPALTPKTVVRAPLPPPPRPRRATEEPKNLRTEKPITPPPVPPTRGGEERPRPAVETTPLSGESGQVSVNEELYRSTLEELAKMREEEGRMRTRGQAVANREERTVKREEPLTPPAFQAPSPQKERGEIGRPFSVNEAIIHGGINGEEGGDHGVLPAHKEVDDKLKKLEDKLK